MYNYTEILNAWRFDMNKKILVVAAVLMVVCAAGAFAFGIGVQGGGGYPAAGNAAITFKLDSVPLVFAANFTFNDGGFAVGGTADYWLFNNNIAGPLNWFLGLGAGATVGGFSDEVFLNAQGRLPIGLNMFLVDGFIEPYVQVVPMLVVPIVPSFGIDFGIDANIGLRLWF